MRLRNHPTRSNKTVFVKYILFFLQFFCANICEEYLNFLPNISQILEVLHIAQAIPIVIK